jgi:hypothetical protein
VINFGVRPPRRTLFLRPEAEPCLLRSRCLNESGSKLPHSKVNSLNTLLANHAVQNAR